MLKVNQENLHFRAGFNFVPETTQSQIDDILADYHGEHPITLTKNCLTGELHIKTSNQPEGNGHLLTFTFYYRAESNKRQIDEASDNYFADVKRDLLTSDDKENYLINLVMTDRIPERAINEPIDWFKYRKWAIASLLYEDNNALPHSQHGKQVLKNLIKSVLAKKGLVDEKTDLYFLSRNTVAYDSKVDTDLAEAFEDGVATSRYQTVLNWQDLEALHGAGDLEPDIEDRLESMVQRQPNKLALNIDTSFIRQELDSQPTEHAKYTNSILHHLMENGIVTKIDPDFKDSFLNAEDYLPEKTEVQRLLKRYFLCQPLASQQEITKICQAVFDNAIANNQYEIFNPDDGINAIYAGLKNGYGSKYQYHRVRDSLTKYLPPLISHFFNGDATYLASGADLDHEVSDSFLEDFEKCEKYYIDSEHNVYALIFDLLEKNCGKGNSAISDILQDIWKENFGETFFMSCGQLSHSPLLSASSDQVPNH